MMHRYTPLKRKAPIARHWTPKAECNKLRRAPLKKQSKSRKAKMEVYYRARERFLRDHPVCGACLTRDMNPGVATQCHHARGRIGRLLLDERFWIGVCEPCHSWIHAHANQARDLGLIAPLAEWNVYPQEQG